MRLSLGHLTVSDVPVVEVLKIAYEIGFDAVCLFLKSPVPRPFPIDSIDSEAAASKVRALMDSLGLSVGTTESFQARAEVAPADFSEMLDIASALGARRITGLNFCPEESLAVEKFAQFCEMARPHGITVALECFMGSSCKNIADATRILDRVGASNLGLVIDVLHLIRNGDGAQTLRALDPSLLDYMQISDGPARADFTAHMHEARADRAVPGDGQFPLIEILSAMPQTALLCAEVPTERWRDKLTALERATRVLAGTQEILRLAGR